MSWSMGILQEDDTWMLEVGRTRDRELGSHTPGHWGPLGLKSKAAKLPSHPPSIAQSYYPSLPCSHWSYKWRPTSKFHRKIFQYYAICVPTQFLSFLDESFAKGTKMELHWRDKKSLFSHVNKTENSSNNNWIKSLHVKMPHLISSDLHSNIF